jgi:hypothetical protein
VRYQNYILEELNAHLNIQNVPQENCRIDPADYTVSDAQPLTGTFPADDILVLCSATATFCM